MIPNTLGENMIDNGRKNCQKYIKLYKQTIFYELFKHLKFHKYFGVQNIN